MITSMEVNQMDEIRKPIPRRIFRVTFTRSDGTRFWRYVKCPYQVKSPEDWGDSLVGMQTALAERVLTGEIERFAISAVAPARTHAAAERATRWHEVAAATLAA
jgi:hypothetical protein